MTPNTVEAWRNKVAQLEDEVAQLEEKVRRQRIRVYGNAYADHCEVPAEGS